MIDPGPADPLAIERPMQRLQVGRVGGPGIDHRHLARTDDVGPRTGEGERAGILGDHPPDQRRDLIGLAVAELEVTDMGDHGGWRPGACD